MSEKFKLIIDKYFENDSKKSDYIKLDTLSLSSQERLEIHSYCQNKGLKTESINMGIGKIINVYSLEYIKNNKNNPHFNKALNDIQIKFFCKNMNLPIPWCSVNTIDYYLEVLDKYYDNCIEKFELFKEENKNGIDISQEMKIVTTKVVNYLKTCIEKRNIKEHELLKNLKSGDKHKSPIYNGNNYGKNFVSFDIKKANFTSLRYFFPEIFNPDITNLEYKPDSNKLCSWYEFISQFTKSEFIRNCKRTREVIFGMSGFSKLVARLQEHIINEFYLYLCKNSKYFAKTKFCYKKGDELIFELPNNIENINNNLIKEINELTQNYPNFDETFHLEIFELIKIEKTKFCYKKFYNSSKIVFRMVPKNYLIQVIKHIENKLLTELDLTSVDNNGYPYTYKYSIFDAMSENQN